MKILALNSSPRIKGQSKTELMLSHLIAGMEKAGAQVEVVHLRNKKIKNCVGCFSCWTKSPGRCIHRDDMSEELFPKFIESDIAIYATPLYHYTMNAVLKAFIERTLPVLEPFIQDKKGVSYHPLRLKHPVVVVLSVAGFSEMLVFDQLSNHMRFMYNKGLIAEIYRPAAEAFVLGPNRKVRDDILSALTQAGEELVKNMKVEQQTMERIIQPIGDKKVMARAANIFWKTCIREKMTPEEMRAKGAVPRPETIEDFALLMKMAYKPEAAGNAKAVLQFDFTGEQTGSCSFLVSGDGIEESIDPPSIPDLLVRAPFEVWMDVFTKKTDGQDAFMKGRYTAQGDLTLLAHMKELFGSA
jgi:multimeric flavodoxin WrbA/putative sterol carrier protein